LSEDQLLGNSVPRLVEAVLRENDFRGIEQATDAKQCRSRLSRKR